MCSMSRFGSRIAIVVALVSFYAFFAGPSLFPQDASSHGTVAQDSEQDWQKQYEAKISELKQKNGDGINKGLRSQLLKMRNEDQDVRKRALALPPDRQGSLASEMQHTDQNLTRKLEEIVANYGWPTISLVGLEASQAAATILIHSRDHIFQQALLPMLDQMVEKNEIAGSDIALLKDKLLVAQGQPQEFGSQFTVRAGKMVMDPVEDPGHLEQRRAQYLLPPMPVYKKMLAELYHMPVE
jgi:hypothetical protein